MKKIFLTSGIVVCMACPAFGAGTGFPIGEGAGQYTAAQLNGNVIQNTCVEPTLGLYSGNVTLQAIWNPDGQVVTYARGKTGGYEPLDLDNMPNPTSVDVTFDAPFTVDPTHRPTARGYHFVNWKSDFNLSTGEASNDTYYNPATLIQNYKVASPDQATLTAQWEPNIHSINYAKGTASNGSISHSGNDISGSTAGIAEAVYDHVGYKAAQNGFSIYGYHFTGWTSNRDASTGAAVDTPYAVGATLGNADGKYKVDADTVLTAQWEPDTYTVTYACGTGASGSPATANTTVHYDDVNFSWAGNTDRANCKKAGYHFTGWTCSVGDTDIITNSGVSCDTKHVCTGSAVAQWTTAGLTNGTNIACTAQYEVNEIGLNWDLDGGTGEVPANGTDSCTYNDSITLPANPTRDGYTFGGWKIYSGNPDTTLPTEY